MENRPAQKNRGINASIKLAVAKARILKNETFLNFETNRTSTVTCPFGDRKSKYDLIMSTEIPILPLTETERLWMEEVYNRNLTGQRFSARDIWSVLHERLPRFFRPPAMDPRLIIAGGVKVCLLGIIALQGDHAILAKVNQVINWIRQQLLEAAETNNIATDAIAQGTGLTKEEVHMVLNTVQEFGKFYRISSFGTNNLFITTIEIGGEDEVYYQYIDFPGIEQLIKYKSYAQYRQPVESFTYEEMQSANDKLEIIIEDIQKLKAGQEVIWTDVRKELEELKALYFLGKKNWRQLLLGKLTEMTAAGLVGDTLSKAIEEMLKPIVSTFLPWN